MIASHMKLFHAEINGKAKESHIKYEGAREDQNSSPNLILKITPHVELNKNKNLAVPR
jgi:hypothetical protein